MTDDMGAGPAREPEVAFAPRGDADALAAALADLVNAVYAVAEDGMWQPDTPRTTVAELADLVAAGEILVARLDGAVVGCVRVRRTADGAGEFAMLAADPRRRGVGIGRVLVAAAEEHCRTLGCPVMRLELLVPQGREQASKVFLHQWYSRLGYRRTGTGSIACDHPNLAPMLAEPCDYVMYEKQLSAPAAAGR